LFKPETHAKLKWWPSLQDYNEAIQLHRTYVEDVELKSARPYEDAMGLPRPVTGAFSTVYRLESSAQDLAFKLFLKDIHDQEARYALISDFLGENKLSYFVSFKYLITGIKIRGDWFPGLRMDWIEGVPIDEYIVLNLGDSAKLGELAAKFLKMMEEFHRLGMAHGDLQHGNIIICGDEIRVVDYDGMFVPHMGSFAACELGHRNYQHPKRTALHFGPYLDNFSAWVIYASIKALQLDPKLLNQLGGADDCLLFRETDFLNPLESAAFAAFERHPSSELNALSKFIRAQLTHDISQIPYLQPSAPILQSALPDIPEAVNTVKAGPRLVRGNTDEWLDSDNLDLARSAIEGSGGGDRLQTSWAVPAKDGPAAAWNKPGSAVPDLFLPDSKDVSAEDVVTIPPELKGAKPRQIKLRDFFALGKQVVFQILLMLPLWWLSGITYNLISVDYDLKWHAKNCTAIVQQTTVREEQRSKGGLVTVTDVAYKYFVEGVAYEDSQTFDSGTTGYKKGSKLTVYFDPYNPKEKEPLNTYPGKRLERDWGNFCFLAFLCLFLEWLVWWRALIALYLVREGTPVFMTVRNKKDHGRGVYFTDLKFTLNGRPEKRCILLNQTEYETLFDGDVVVALYDRSFEPLFPLLQIYDYSAFEAKTRRP
jgi:hypothetical protein